jgi:hypothetical protein
MIKNINSSSPHLFVAGGSSGGLPWVGASQNPIQGVIRVNGADMEVYDGNGWVKIYMNDASVGLNKSADVAISWAIRKMEEEQEWQKLAECNQAVKIALDNLEQARRQVNITAKLAREYDTTS